MTTPPQKASFSQSSLIFPVTTSVSYLFCGFFILSLQASNTIAKAQSLGRIELGKSVEILTPEQFCSEVISFVGTAIQVANYLRTVFQTEDRTQSSDRQEEPRTPPTCNKTIIYK
jgi:hypothetical protein